MFDITKGTIEVGLDLSEHDASEVKDIDKIIPVAVLNDRYLLVLEEGCRVVTVGKDRPYMAPYPTVTVMFHNHFSNDEVIEYLEHALAAFKNKEINFE